MQHLIKAKECCGLVAAVTFSSSWNLHLTTMSLETKVNWLLYNNYLTNNLIEYIERQGFRSNGVIQLYNYIYFCSNRTALILRGIVDSDTTAELMTKVRRVS